MRFDKCSQAIDQRVFRQARVDEQRKDGQSPYISPTKLASGTDSQEKLRQIELCNMNLYTAVAKEEMNKITKKHSFRNYIN